MSSGSVCAVGQNRSHGADADKVLRDALKRGAASIGEMKSSGRGAEGDEFHELFKELT
jgi:hypothetical protein